MQQHILKQKYSEDIFQIYHSHFISEIDICFGGWYRRTELFSMHVMLQLLHSSLPPYVLLNTGQTPLLTSVKMISPSELSVSNTLSATRQQQPINTLQESCGKNILLSRSEK